MRKICHVNRINKAFQSFRDKREIRLSIINNIFFPLRKAVNLIN